MRVRRFGLWLAVVALAGFVIATGVGAWVGGATANDIVTGPWEPGGLSGWGADHVGRDVFTRTLAGGFTIVAQSLLIGPATTLLGGVIAVLAAGYPRWARWVTEAATLFLAVPAMVLVVVLTAWTSATVAVLVVMLVAGVPFTVRVLLPVVQAHLTEPFVEVGQVRGDGRWLVLFRDVVPAALAAVLSDAVTRTVVTVHLFVAVHALGRGPQAPQADWGVMMVANLPGFALNPVSVLAPAVGLVLWCVLLGVLADRVNAVLAVDGSTRSEPRGWLRRVVPGGQGVVLCAVQLVQDDQVLLTVPEFSATQSGVTAVLGPTGSGKSTLVSVCAGLSRPGLQVVADGSDFRVAGVPRGRRARRSRLGWVDQDPARTFAPRASVLDVVRDGRGWLSAARCGEVLSAVGLPERLWSQSAVSLSGGQAVRVAVARAVVSGPEVLVLDEPTAGLDQESAQAVADVVRGAAKSAAVIVVSHDVAFVRQVAASVYAVRDRVLVSESVDQLVGARVAGDRGTGALVAGGSAGGTKDGAGLVLDQVQVGFAGRLVCAPVSAQVGCAGLVAVVGPSGCGKSTLLRALAGLHPWVGAVRWHGEVISGAVGLPGVFWVPQDSARALPPMSSLAGLTARYGVGAGRVRNVAAAEVLSGLGVSAVTARRRPGEVSGGQRQRTALAQALVSDASVLLLDEPTSALDEVTTGVVTARLRNRVVAGSLVVVATHDPVVIAEADQVITVDPLAQ